MSKESPGKSNCSAPIWQKLGVADPGRMQVRFAWLSVDRARSPATTRPLRSNPGRRLGGNRPASGGDVEEQGSGGRPKQAEQVARTALAQTQWVRNVRSRHLLPALLDKAARRVRVFERCQKRPSFLAKLTPKKGAASCSSISCRSRAVSFMPESVLRVTGQLVGAIGPRSKAWGPWQSRARGEVLKILG